jgi:hypothetical protein
MPRYRVSRLSSLAGELLVFLGLAAPPTLTAQDFDPTATSTQYTIDGKLVNELPVDRAIQALTLLPGVATDATGELEIRGGRPGDVAVYLDGVPILSAFRSTPFFGLAISRTLESRTSIAPNLVDSISALTGPLQAELGNGQAGSILLHTRVPQSGMAGAIRYETDEPFGSTYSFGLNRVEANIEGLLGRFGFLVGGMLEGQRAVDRGFQSEDAPIFVQLAADTVVAVPSSPGDPFSDTTQVTVYDYATSRGRCEDFSGSNNAEIAGNFGIDCQGAQTPFSAVSTYELAGKLTYGLGRSRFSLLALADQHQNRNFDYGMLYNSPGATGNRATSTVFVLGWTQQLNQDENRPFLIDAHLSLQSDRERSGPLAPEGVNQTADPFGGFLLGPLGLRFDFDNFPVDDELVQNYRTNEVGSRRSPYDLENTAQYSLIDRYRNDAYGLYNLDPVAPLPFFDGGGPVGPLILYRESRSLGSVSLSWKPGAAHRLLLGGEFTRFSIDNYAHVLTSQNGSDVYIEHPIQGALFLQDRVTLGAAAISAGLRYDFYDTRARRPASFPRISSHPLFDPSDPEAFFTNDSLFPRDDTHGRLSPRIQASFTVSPRTEFRGGVATQAQAPDFRASLLRVNTDASITDVNTIFGTDLDFERTTTYELGVRQAVSSDFSVDLSVYSTDFKSQVTTELVQRFDPSFGSTRNLRVLTNNGDEQVRGLDLRVEGHFGAALRGWLSYSYQNATSKEVAGLQFPTRVPTLNSRPHSVAGAASLSVPADWKPGSFAGAVLRNVGVYTIFRVASGTPYTSCPSGDFSVLSPDLCSVITADQLNDERLPTFKQLDLRLSKHFGPGGRFAGYLDARNLLNFKNVYAVFAATGTTNNPVEVDINWSADSADLGNEATANGTYLPDGSINLGQALPDPRLACATWIDQSGTPSSPNCVYLIRAEERFGNGDHLFDLAEQRRASEALYRVARGAQEFTGPPRRIRVGVEVGF